MSHPMRSPEVIVLTDPLPSSCECVCVSLSLSGLLSLCVVGEKEVGAMGDISKSSVPY